MERNEFVIGPQGPLAGLIQFIAVSIIGLLALVYFTPLEVIVMKFIPGSLVVLIVLGHLSLLGDNFPLAPPGGSWAPGKSRLTAGIGMAGIWVGFSVIILCFMMYVYPKWPISPLYLWFGVIAFALTLLYGINWNGWPFKGKVHPWVMMAISFGIIMLLSAMVWRYLTNLDGTPFADMPMNHHGPLNVQWLTGYLVWCIAWFFIFNPVFTTQGWPFSGLGHPGSALAQTVVAFFLGYVCWNGSLSIGWSPTFSFAAVASSIILWSLAYGWHFQFWGITKLTHGKRALVALAAQIAIVAVWIAILRMLLGPAASGLAASQLPADINILIIYFNLCVVGPALIAHNAFALRWPLSIPAPPGTPPPDQSV